MRTVKLLPLLLLVGASSSALAERRNPLAGQPAVRHKVELRRLRFEISPQFMTSTNQDYRHAFGPGVNLGFHITDWLAIGAQVSVMFNSNTPLEDKVRGQLAGRDESKGFVYQYPGPQPSLQMHDERILNINFLGSVYASVTPWYGKFSMFSALFFNYDFYVSGGIGFVNYSQNNCCKHIDRTHPDPSKGETLADSNLEDPSIFSGFKVGGMIGVGVHIYFNDWIGAQLELRDYITKANPGGADVNADRHLTSDDEGPQNNIFFGFGVTLMLPPRAKISK
ncbi:MAG TPA: outer membrane beta-barrel domain-containing protein [Polyangia bacterium]|nr:outer membrane beta-barrel domain-containing protein [Polyangia bacterium]